MDSRIIDFINNQRIGVISVEMLDGSPHSATVHFAHTLAPFSIIILTDKHYRKCESILEKQETRASFVTGTDEATMKTLQLDGIVKFLSKDDVAIKDAYFKKFPEKEKFFVEPDSVFLHFTPTWWRYTDFKAEAGKLIIENQ